MKIELQLNGFVANNELRRFIKGFAESAFESRRTQIEFVRIRLDEVAEARDGNSKSCLLQIGLRGGQKVIVEVMDSDIYVAVQRAIDRACFTVMRNLRRGRPLVSNMLLVERHQAAGQATDRAA